MKWNRHKTVIFSLFLLMTGCPQKPDNITPGPTTAIMISPQQGNVALGGTTLKISAVGVTASGAVGDPVSIASWWSSDPSIATIDSNGVVSAVSLGVTTIMADSGDLHGTAVIGVVSRFSGAEDLNITGQAFYEDKPYNQNGFTNKIVNEPIRHAVVELIAIDGFTALASGTTQEDGTYQFSAINNNARRGGVYVRVLATTGNPVFSAVTVQDNSKDKNILAVQGRPLDDAVSDSFPSDQIIAPALGIGGAFNIMDLFLKGGEFIQKINGCAMKSADCKPTPLTAYWERGVPNGTSYEDTSNVISINGGLATPGTTNVTGDTDEYDDTILLHEYGHLVSAQFSRDESPGGTHSFFDNTQDIRLAWSEGWATFFAGAVLGSPLTIDTKDHGSLFGINIETAPNLSYTTSEASVSSILWDIFDPVSQGSDDDPISTVGFNKIWKGFTDMTGPATMESFALELARQNPEQLDPLQNILKGKKIELFADQAETTGETPLILNIAQHHTLYQLGSPFLDEDVISFSMNAGQKYSIKTIRLINGADTFLTLEDSNVLLQNDNADGQSYVVNCSIQCPRNDGQTLASSIFFQSQTARQLSIRIKRSPHAPHSTGLTGSYDILLTSP